MCETCQRSTLKETLLCVCSARAQGGGCRESGGGHGDAGRRPAAGRQRGSGGGPGPRRHRHGDPAQRRPCRPHRHVHARERLLQTGN